MNFDRSLLLVPLFSIIPFTVSTDGNEPTAAMKKGLDTIRAEDAMKHVNILASKEFEGRETGEPGCEKAAAYLSKQFESLGLVPLGDTVDGKPTYLQHYPITISGVDSNAGLIIKDKEGKETTISFGADLRSLIALPPKNVADFCNVIDAGIVTIDEIGESAESKPADGAPAPRYKIKLPSGAAGNFVIIRLKDIKVGSFELHGVVATALNDVRAKGGILVSADGSKEFSERFKRAVNWATRRTKRYGSPGAAAPPSGNSNNPPIVLLSDPLFVEGMAGKQAKFNMSIEPKEYKPSNIVGMLKGTDPAVNDTYIVHSGHYDHEGIKGTEIYFGADDNASGTTAVLEIAKAYKSTDAPRRSIIFLLVSGEEKGLWGSEYFTDHSPVAREKLIADINTDMVGRTLLNGEQKPAYMMMTPSPRNQDYNTLAARSNELSEQYGFPKMENGDKYWTRSDHYNFAKHGIPTMFLCNGEHEDYHRPTDTADKIDGDKIARSAKLAFHLGYEVAMSDVLPKVTGRVTKKPSTTSQPAKDTKDTEK